MYDEIHMGCDTPNVPRQEHESSLTAQVERGEFHGQQVAGPGRGGWGESRGCQGVLGLRAHPEAVVSRVDGRRSVGDAGGQVGGAWAGVKVHSVGEAVVGGRVEDGRGGKLGTAARGAEPRYHCSWQGGGRGEP